MGSSRSYQTSSILLILAIVGSLVAIPARADRPSRRVATPEELSVLGKGTRQLENGMFLITLSDGNVLMTHGPDPRHDHEGSLSPGGAERDPKCATDYFQHVLYSHLFFLPSRFEEVKSEIASAIKRMNFLLNQEAVESGSVNADFKVKCDSEDNLQIDQFASLGTEYELVVDSARDAGFDDPHANYSIFLDWNHPAFCGVASLWEDESPEESNLNNRGGGYAVTYEPCWDRRTPMHENGHNMGATQYSAPDSTGSGHHCYDQYDVMCYTPDGGDRNQLDEVFDCPDEMHYDCEHDTYFDAAPEEGEYLADHWNVGSRVNRFIAFGDSVAPPPSPTSSRAPDAYFDAECINARCKFRNRTYDWDGDLQYFEWDLGDGSPVSNAYAPLYNYASSGSYQVTLRAFDDAGNVGTAVRTVHVFTQDPDPEAPTLGQSSSQYLESGESGSWLYFKVQVPSEGSLYASTSSPCGFYICYNQPPVEYLCLLQECDGQRVFLKKSSRPTENSNDCATEPNRLWASCWIDRSSNLEGGLWYIGILAERANSEFYFSSS